MSIQKKKRETNAKSGGGSVHENILDISRELSALNYYSAGIGSTLNSLNDYSSIIEIQGRALEPLLDIQNTPTIQHISKMANAYQEALAPVSSVIANIGILNANLEKSYSLGSITNEYLNLTENLSSMVLDSIQDQQNIFETNFSLSKDFDSTNFANLTENITPTIQTISSGINEMLLSLGESPRLNIGVAPELQIISEVAEIKEEELQEYQARLDSLLDKIDPQLVKFRKGAWAAFNAKGEDYIGQASSSMRRLVDTLLRGLAPEDNVKKTIYFKTSPSAKSKDGNPTRRARVFYIVGWDNDKACRFERLTTGFLQAYDNLSSWDHVPLDDDGFVHGALVVIEGHILSLLSAYQDKLNEKHD